MNATAGVLASRYVYRNPLDLPRISYAEIVGNSAEGVYVEQPGELRLFRTAPPVFHDDPDGACLFQPFQERVVTYPPVFTTSLRGVTLMGYRSVLSPHGFFVNDTGHLAAQDVRSFTKGLDHSEEMTGLQSMEDGETFVPAVPGKPEIHLDGPVVVLSSIEPGNFGSFLYRELVKLVNLVEVPSHWRLLVHLRTKTQEQFLELAGFPMDRLIRHDLGVTYHIDQAIIPGLRNPYAHSDPQTRGLYDRLRTRCVSGARGRWIYVSRASIPAGRVMLNEGELIEQLRPLGFDIVEPQNLTAAEQIETFASADIVVGPSGSGMFNAVFCRLGTKLIDIESEPHWIYPHSCLFASAGLQYGIFEGLAANRDWSVHHKPWRVNIEALLSRIASFAPQREGVRASNALIPVTTRLQTSNAISPPLWSMPDLAGEVYTTVLQRFHQTFTPQTYLEIGVADGASLKLANCFTIGIDPRPRIDGPYLNNKPACCLYQMTSDRFFKKNDPSSVFGQPIDIAFLDGMHLFEYLLRDFINVEKHCKPNSIIFMHDCIPTDEYIGRRELNDHGLRGQSAHPDWWAGDVWKVLAILQAFRPDLRITVFDAVPTGLVAVTRLDPSSKLLTDKYFDLIEDYKGRTLTEHGGAYFGSLKMLDTRQYASLEALSSLFWL